MRRSATTSAPGRAGIDSIRGSDDAHTLGARLRQIQNSDGGDVEAGRLRSGRGRLRRRPGDVLTLAALALAILAAAETMAGVRAADVEAKFLALLAIHAMSDDTTLLIEQLRKMGMP
jgi:hypothetical protein